MSAYDVVISHYDANDRGDMEGMLAVLAPDARWTEMEGFPTAGTYVGPDEIFKGVFQRLGDEFGGTYRCEIDELIDGGDTVVGLGRYSGTYQATGKYFSARVAHVWRVQGEKVVAFEQFTDTLLLARATESY